MVRYSSTSTSFKVAGFPDQLYLDGLFGKRKIGRKEVKHVYKLSMPELIGAGF